MKKYIYRTLPILFAGFFAAAFNGCILDAINSFPINVPITIEFQTQGSGSDYSDTEEFCLSDSPTFMDYIKDVKNITFLGVTYRTKSITPNDVHGDLTITLLNNGVPFFSKIVTGATPSDYLPPNPPLKVELTTTQLDSLNSFLNSSLPPEQKCFTGTVSIHVPGGSNVVLDAYVDIAIQMDTSF